MTERPAVQTFPRRDAAGRVMHFPEFVAGAALGVLVGLLALAVIDGIVALLGLARFGSASGWLAVILPALLFFDDLRGWRGHGVRFLVAPVSAAVAIGLGLIAAGLATGLPPMASGAVGALVAAVAYAVIWFPAIRWLAGENVSRRER